MPVIKKHLYAVCNFEAESRSADVVGVLLDWHQAAASTVLVFSLGMAASLKRSVMNFSKMSSVSSFVISDVGSGMTLPNSV